TGGVSLVSGETTPIGGSTPAPGTTGGVLLAWGETTPIWGSTPAGTPYGSGGTSVLSGRRTRGQTTVNLGTVQPLSTVSESSEGTASVGSSRFPSNTTSAFVNSPTTFEFCDERTVVIGVNGEAVPYFFVEPISYLSVDDINPGGSGIQFPKSNKGYIIVVPLSIPSVVKSVVLPGGTNVNQIRVMLLNNNNETISDGSGRVFTFTSSKVVNPSVRINLKQKTSAVHITLLTTEGDQPPRNVTVSISACVESGTTFETTMSSVTSFVSQQSSERSHYSTSPPPIRMSTPHSPSFSPCQVKRQQPSLLVIGKCISQQEIEQDYCAGYCPSFEELDMFGGLILNKECLCCTAGETYYESVTMSCSNNDTSNTERRSTQITRIRSCQCYACQKQVSAFIGKNETITDTRQRKR
ncbi:unnamed protein product, partial [Didymodactylos carnosus]